MVFLRVAVALLSLAISSYADRFELVPVADTTLLEWLPTNNLGKTLHLRVGAQFVGRSRALMKFDLSGIASTAKVVYAQLKLTGAFPPVEGDPYNSRSGGGVKLFRELRAWSEGSHGGELGQPESGSGATWFFANGVDHPWLEPGGQYSSEWFYLESTPYMFPPFPGGGVMRLSGAGMMQDVQRWIEQPEQNYGWMLYGSEQDKACCLTGSDGVAHDYYSFSAITIASREDEQNSPQLIVGVGNPAAPLVFINGEFFDAEEAEIDAPSTLTLSTLFPDGRIFYSLDGSRPTLASPRYSAPIVLNGGEVIRAIAYSSDYSAGGVERPVIKVQALAEFALEYVSDSRGRIDILDNGVPVPTSETTGRVLIASNHVVRVTAVPTAGYSFAGWSGDFTNSDASLTFSMKAPVSLKAGFVQALPPGPLLTVRGVPPDFLVVQFSAESGSVFQVQTSIDLTHWTVFQTYSNKVGVVDTIVSLPGSSNQAFYRIQVNAFAPSPPY